MKVSVNDPTISRIRRMDQSFHTNIGTPDRSRLFSNKKLNLKIERSQELNPKNSPYMEFEKSLDNKHEQ